MTDDLFGTLPPAPVTKPRIIVLGAMFCDGVKVAPEIGCMASKHAVRARALLDKGFRPQLIATDNGSSPWNQSWRARSLFSCPYCGKHHSWDAAQNGRPPKQDKTAAQNEAIEIYHGMRCSGCGCRFEVRRKNRKSPLRIHQLDQL